MPWPSADDVGLELDPQSSSSHLDDELDPQFRVKRWASKGSRSAPYLEDPSTTFVPPSSKSPPAALPALQARWCDGRFSSEYRPRFVIPGVGVGLPPPPTFGASPGSAPLRVGGLVHTLHLWVFITLACARWCPCRLVARSPLYLPWVRWPLVMMRPP